MALIIIIINSNNNNDHHHHNDRVVVVVVVVVVVAVIVVTIIFYEYETIIVVWVSRVGFLDIVLVQVVAATEIVLGAILDLMTILVSIERFCHRRVRMHVGGADITHTLHYLLDQARSLYIGVVIVVSSHGS